MRSTMVAAVVVGLIVSACGDPEPAGGALPPPSIAASTDVPADTETGALGPEATIVGVFDGVRFYPACGNESLGHGGVAWYQVQKFDFPEIYERAANGYRENPPEHVVVRGFAPRVAEPGPGDDIGTLVVWSDAVAYFVSDSGDLHAWLVQDELTYGWEC